MSGEKKVAAVFSVSRAILAAMFVLSTAGPDASALDTGKHFTVFNKLLRKYADNGKVDYIEWKRKDLDVFAEEIKALSDVSPEGMGPEEEKAFWINAYNALAVYTVMKYLPADKISASAFSVRFIPGFFNGLKYNIAGEILTLDDIENVKLREGFKDPRIHSAICRASRGSPKILSAVFNADGLDKALDESMRRFLRDPEKNRLDRNGGVLFLSDIFNRHKNDFKDTPGGIIAYVSGYLAAKDAEFLSKQDCQVKYLFYNWLLNIK